MKKTGVLLFCMLLSGTLLYFSWRLPERESSLYVQEEIGAGQTVEQQPEQVTADKDDALRRAQENCYAFAQLSGEEQDLYLEILDALLYFRENVKLSSCDKELISRIFQCVLNDHPEIFYVEGYTYTEYTLGSLLKKITFTGSYSISREEAEKKQRQIDSYVNQCLAGIPEGADEYGKVKYIYEYLIHHTDYDVAAKDSQNICSVFLEEEIGLSGICEGDAVSVEPGRHLFDAGAGKCRGRRGARMESGADRRGILLCGYDLGRRFLSGGGQRLSGRGNPHDQLRLSLCDERADGTDTHFR